MTHPVTDARDALYAQGLNDGEIARRLGLTQSGVMKWRHRRGLKANAVRSPAKLNSPEVRTMYDSGATDGEIARKFGVTQSGVTRWRQKHGLTPKADYFRATPAEVRRNARKLLREGQSRKQVASVIGLSRTSLSRLRQEIGPDPRLRQTGQRVEVSRLAAVKAGRDLFVRLRKATRYMTDPVLRDDVISEMYLALMEGKLAPAEIERAVRTFSGRAIDQWQSRWGPASLDAALTEDGFTLADTIACPAAEAWLESTGA